MQNLLNIAYIFVSFCVIVYSAPQQQIDPQTPTDPPASVPENVSALEVSSSIKPANVDEAEKATTLPPTRAPQFTTTPPPIMRSTMQSKPEDIKQDSDVNSSHTSTEISPSSPRKEKDGNNAATGLRNIYFFSIASSLVVLMYSAF